MHGYAQTFELKTCELCLKSVTEKRARVSNSKKDQKLIRGLDFKLEYNSLKDTKGLLFLADAQQIRIINNEWDSIWASSFLSKARAAVLKTPSCINNLLTATFKQATSTDWHIPENWDTCVVPNLGTIATIPSSKKCTIANN